MKSKKGKKNITKEDLEILAAIEKLKTDIAITRQNFNLATDESLIDGYIYEIISLNKKYDYFINLARQHGLIAEGFEKIS